MQKLSIEWAEAHTLLDAASITGTALPDRIRALLAERDRLITAQEADHARPPRERLLEQLNEDRSQILLLLPDACLDEGREAEAQGWGWLAIHRKWPSQVAGKGWCWRRWVVADTRSAPNVSRESDRLPLPLYLAVGAASRAWPGPSDALDAVVQVIVEGRWTIGAAEPPKCDHAWQILAGTLPPTRRCRLCHTLQTYPEAFP